eukprot:1256313-Prymnesium_polylepis.1
MVAMKVLEAGQGNRLTTALGAALKAVTIALKTALNEALMAVTVVLRAALDGALMVVLNEALIGDDGGAGSSAEWDGLMEAGPGAEIS